MSWYTQRLRGEALHRLHLAALLVVGTLAFVFCSFLYLLVILYSFLV